MALVSLAFWRKPALAFQGVSPHLHREPFLEILGVGFVVSVIFRNETRKEEWLGK